LSTAHVLEPGPLVRTGRYEYEDKADLSFSGDNW
jgi:hypothetical protein